MKKLLTLFALSFLSTYGFGQSESDEPYCTVLVHYSNPPPLLTYLFSKYGIEDSERIMTNIKTYELSNTIIVMDNNRYQEYIESINSQLIGQSDPTKILILQSEKLKVENILNIETIVSQ